jgi:sulfonate transport system permease protein
MAEEALTGIATPDAGARPATAAPAPRRRLPLGLILPLACLLLWQAAAGLGWIESDLLPGPLEILQTLSAMAQDGSLATDIGATCRRLAFGFMLGTAAATLAGALTGTSPLCRRLLDPTLQALRSVPSLAWVPLFIIWFGIYDVSKVLLIAIGVFFPIYLNLMNGIANVDRRLIEVGQVHGYSRLLLMLRIQLPAALPAYITGLRGGLGLGWMFIASAEMMGASDGLGFILTNGEEIGRPDQVIAAIFVFAVLGKTTDWVLAKAGASLIAWQDTLEAAREQI